MNRLISNNGALLQKLLLINSVRDQAMAANRDKPVVAFDDAANVILKLSERAAPGRVIVGVGGFPASGKTTWGKAVVRNINELRLANLAAHLPMDGFHFQNDLLVADRRDRIKGDVSTYDVESYARTLIRYRDSPNAVLLAPDYCRTRHDVVEDMIEIGPEVRILVTEGIYVGYSTGAGWSAIRRLVDLLFYVDVSPDECADRIVARNLEVGRSELMIEEKLRNDFEFMEKSIQILRQADYIVRPTKLDQPSSGRNVEPVPN
jgi:pantothenate kinase